MRNSIFFVVFLLTGCATKVLHYDKTQELQNNHEFEAAVKIVETPTNENNIDSSLPVIKPQNQNSTKGNTVNADKQSDIKSDKKSDKSSVQASNKSADSLNAETGRNKKTKAGKKNKTADSKAKDSTAKDSNTKEANAKDANTKDTNVKDSADVASGTESIRPPAEENSAGFSGGFQNRRPSKDPFRVGERIVHQVSYFAIKAGTLEFQVRPFAQVNGEQNYQFKMAIKSSTLFASVYSVDDFVDVLMDYNKMIPSVFALHVRETSVLRESRMLFDHQNKKATFWDKKVTEKDGEENKKKEWDLADYAQNVYSAVFYMRAFPWEVGVTNAFRVSNDGDNLLFKATAIRKEKLETAVGTFNAIVLRPEVELKGKFQPIGENLIWLSDDDRKYILRIEAKIKIGSLVSEISELNPGSP